MGGDLRARSDRPPRVFLSYARDDSTVAQEIADRLTQAGAHVWFDRVSLKTGESWANAVQEALTASDYVVVLLSPSSVRSSWVNQEIGAALQRELATRDVTVLPVLIGDVAHGETPALLADRVFLDLRMDVGPGLDRLVAQLGLAPQIDFSRLGYRQFGQLIVGLLQARGFVGIRTEVERAGHRFDIAAQYHASDPFGADVVEEWVVEVKFYATERAGVASLHELLGHLAAMGPAVHGLLVTNSHLTRHAQELVHATRDRGRVDLRVLEGTDLKRLLLPHADLVRTFFGRRGET